MFISSGVGAPGCVCVAFELIPFYGLGVPRGKEVAVGGRAAGKSHRTPNCHTSKQGEVPLPANHDPPWRRLCGPDESGGVQERARISQSSSVSEQMAHSDTAE